MKNKIARESNTILRRKLLSAFLIAALAVAVFNWPTPASAAVDTKNEPVVFADKIVDGVIPQFIDGDKVDIGPILNPLTRDGGGSQYISSQYIRNQTIGNIFNWTSASSVTKSNGFDISSTISATVYGINMSINIGWQTNTSYTWTKDKGYSQFKVIGIGDIRIDKYYNLRTNYYYYVKHTINQEDIKYQR